MLHPGRRRGTGAGSYHQRKKSLHPAVQSLPLGVTEVQSLRHGVLRLRAETVPRHTRRAPLARPRARGVPTPELVIRRRRAPAVVPHRPRACVPCSLHLHGSIITARPSRCCGWRRQSRGGQPRARAPAGAAAWWRARPGSRRAGEQGAGSGRRRARAAARAPPCW